MKGKMKREKDSTGEMKHPTPFEKSRMRQEDTVDEFRKCGKKNPDHTKNYGRKKFTKDWLTPKEAAQCIPCSMEWLGIFMQGKGMMTLHWEWDCKNEKTVKIRRDDCQEYAFYLRKRGIKYK